MYYNNNMALDFTLRKYEELCKFLVDEGIKTLRMDEYLESKSCNGRNLIMRHDIDRYPASALEIAKIENKWNIVSSFYFRMKGGVFIPSLIKDILRLGNEIGYHYEVVDKAEGDLEKAVEIFGGELEEFRKICDVKTIAMHGNPLSKWDNKAIWSKFNFKDYGIIGEAYLSIDYSKVVYLSDTGRTWAKGKRKVKDIAPDSREQLLIASTNELMDFLKTCEQDVCLLVHPNRWSANWHDYVYQWTYDTMGNIVKNLLRLKRRMGLKQTDTHITH